MVWYDTIIILAVILGIILFILGSRRPRRWGMILVLVALITKASLWIAGV
jgi:hypothetical protein